ncbi:MAG: ferrous iron transport protein B [Gammaproteobacteria bacterium]|nr:ferrous iron transport protein B [Gammaproteobacteria bacterium]
MPQRPLVAVLGAPNTGKSTVFNRLTGLRQKTGNYPGVTVERMTGRARIGSAEIDVVDLPGTYSLAADSPESSITLDAILGAADGLRRPDALLLVADASNPRRSLHLFSQSRELGLPVAVALNMQDVARSKGMEIDAAQLAAQIGAPVIPITANRGKGIEKLRGMLERLLSQASPEPEQAMPEVSRAALDLAGQIDAPGMAILELERAIIDQDGEFERRLAALCGPKAKRALERARDQVLKSVGGPSLQVCEAERRYRRVDQWLKDAMIAGSPDAGIRESRLERAVNHPVLGAVVFLGVMGAVFQAVFAWAAPLMEAISGLFETVGAHALSILPPGALASLLVDGLWSGAGAVMVFLPQIVILFALVLFLEDCGYLARASFLMDRLLRLCGMSGQSFIPLLSGFACAVPAIMSTRVIGSRRSRLATIAAIPLMTCSARLPVYALLISGFVPPAHYLNGWINLHGLLLLGLYLLGIAGGALSAVVTRRTALRGGSDSFLMEMPPFRWPNPSVLGLKLLGRAKVFLTRAGTVIAAACLVIWALGYFPRSEAIEQEFAEQRAALVVQREDAEGAKLALQRINAQERAAQLEHSFLGRIGKFIEPAFKPLGWDWRVSASVAAGFPAREVVIGVMGTVYALGADAGDEAGLRDRLQESRWPDGRPVFTLAMALGLLVFYAFALQCVSTVAVIGRETNSWRWAAGAWIYMSGFAWLAGMLTYQLAR